MATIGQKVKTFRTLKGISQQELADKAKSHKTTISRIERDALLPNAQILAALSSMGMDVTDLFEGSKVPSGSKKEQALYHRVSELEIKLLSVESKLAKLIDFIEKKL